LADDKVLDSSYRVYPIRGLVGHFHLLHDVSRGEAVLIDTGLVGEMPRLGRVLKSIGLGWHDIKAILLTHGHLDHTGHLFEIKQRTGAPLLAHPAEQPHINGTFAYRGASRVCGALETFGRWVLRYRTVEIDEPLHAGMELPYWGGLKVIHLPGHTLGHCGFYSARFGLLFSGDLFASYGFFTHLPPAILNSCPEYLDASLERVEELSPRLIIPSHYFGFDGALHSRKFASLAARWKRKYLGSKGSSV
jgi:glyoxylase-like metal-dependent hydrolase (beta-lactamase superfamily II)